MSGSAILRRKFADLGTGGHAASEGIGLERRVESLRELLGSTTTPDARPARAFGDTGPLGSDSHFSVSRDTFHYCVLARECLSRARRDNLLAALYAQAAQGEGRFRFHSLYGRGGKIAPDLAMEGACGRSDAWLIGHFKDPQPIPQGSSYLLLPALQTASLRRWPRFCDVRRKVAGWDFALAATASPSMPWVRLLQVC